MDTISAAQLDRGSWAASVLLIGLTTFVVGLARTTQIEPFRALWLACFATGLAVVLAYAKRAVLAFGWRLRHVKNAAEPMSKGRLLLAVLAELAVVFMIRVGLRANEDTSLWLAAAITGLCMMAMEGNPVLLATRRFLAS